MLLSTNMYHASWFSKPNISQCRIQDFPEVGAPTLGGEGCQHTIFPNVPEKLHEIERIGMPGGGVT